MTKTVVISELMARHAKVWREIADRHNDLKYLETTYPGLKLNLGAEFVKDFATAVAQAYEDEAVLTS